MTIINTDRKKEKIRTSIKFYRPKTLKKVRNPKYKRKLISNEKKNQLFNVIKYPLTTESIVKKIQRGNTIVFIVNSTANKKLISKAVKNLYKASPIKINTLIQANGEKKAFIKLTSDCDALDVANKVGFI
nr:60S ribosomal protein L23A [Cryptomonas curvata]|mmetsp:Transcript_13276/g.28355  ORF Transcript_13276/g.28355 Transcript_13276/m.28355 type:complete len:130 (-) Transcript_13276:4955-5344(-)